MMACVWRGAAMMVGAFGALLHRVVWCLGTYYVRSSLDHC